MKKQNHAGKEEQFFIFSQILLHFFLKCDFLRISFRILLAFIYNFIPRSSLDKKIRSAGRYITIAPQKGRSGGEKQKVSENYRQQKVSRQAAERGGEAQECQRQRPLSGIEQVPASGYFTLAERQTEYFLQDRQLRLKKQQLYA